MNYPPHSTLMFAEAQFVFVEHLEAHLLAFDVYFLDDALFVLEVQLFVVRTFVFDIRPFVVCLFAFDVCLFAVCVFVLSARLFEVYVFVLNARLFAVYAFVLNIRLFVAFVFVSDVRLFVTHSACCCSGCTCCPPADAVTVKRCHFRVESRQSLVRFCRQILLCHPDHHGQAIFLHGHPLSADCYC